MKQLTITRTVSGAVLVVVAQVLLRISFFSLYRLVPEQHAFWSGLALYSGLLSMAVVPAPLTLLILRDRSRFAGLAALVIAVAFVPEMALAAWVSLSWFNAFMPTYCAATAVVSLAVFGIIKVHRDHATQLVTCPTEPVTQHLRRR